MSFISIYIFRVTIRTYFQMFHLEPTPNSLKITNRKIIYWKILIIYFFVFFSPPLIQLQFLGKNRLKVQRNVIIGTKIKKKRTKIKIKIGKKKKTKEKREEKPRVEVASGWKTKKKRKWKRKKRRKRKRKREEKNEDR